MTERTAIRRRSREGSDQRNQQIVIGLCEGRTMADIAAEMGLHPSAIGDRARRYGLKDLARAQSGIVSEARLRADLTDDQAAWLDAQLQAISFADFVRAVIVDAFAEDAARPNYLGLTGGR